MTDGYWLNSDEDKGGDFSAVPAGKYKLLVSDIDVSQTKKKMTGMAMRGEMIKVELEILDDKAAGSRVFERFNISHDNEQAQNIGRGQFARFAKACGVTLKIKEPESKDWGPRQDYFFAHLRSLSDKIVYAELGFRINSYNGREENHVKKWLVPKASGGKELPPDGDGVTRTVESFDTPAQKAANTQDQSRNVDPKDVDIPF